MRRLSMQAGSPTPRPGLIVPRRTLLLGSVALVATACTAQQGGNEPVATVDPSASQEPTTLEMWTNHSGEEAKSVQAVLDQLHTDIPWLTVTLVQGKTDADVLQRINSGQYPDIVSISGPANVGKFSAAGLFPDLGELAQQSGLDIAEMIPPRVLATSSYEGVAYMLPWLTDAYGMFYNTDMFESAGIDSPPKTLEELQAVNEELTTYASDGSIETMGFLPLSTFYHSGIIDKGPTFGAEWYDADGKSAVGTDERWVEGLTWVKEYIDSIGYDKLQEFAAKISNDSEYTNNHALATGQIAMVIDGEWRTMYLDDTGVAYATAPFPTLSEDLYGSGRIGGTMISLCSGAANPSAAWEAVKYLALDTDALNMLANDLKNIPSTYESLETSGYGDDPKHQTFVDILENEHSTYKATSAAGSADVDLMAAFVERVEAGEVSDIKAGLVDLATEIDTQNANAQ